MFDYINKAKRLGFSEAKILNDISLECKSKLRSYCNPQQCSNYGENWVCPPGCGTFEDCRAKTQKFDEGILLQSVSHLTPPTAQEIYSTLNREHNFRFRMFIEAVNPVVEEILPLTSGGCVFCEQCTYPEPCVKPDVKMESLSAFGIDVTALCKAAGLPFSFRDDMVYYTALLLWRK